MPHKFKASEEDHHKIIAEIDYRERHNTLGEDDQSLPSLRVHRTAN